MGKPGEFEPAQEGAKGAGGISRSSPAPLTKSIAQALGRNNGTHGGSDLINNPCELNYDFEPLLGDDWPKEVKSFFSGVGSIKISLDLNAPHSPKCSYGQRNGDVGFSHDGPWLHELN